MEKKKLTAFVILVTFLFSVLLPVGTVWAADPALPEVTVTPWKANADGIRTTTAGTLQLITVHVAPFASESPLDLTLTFPKDLQPQGGSGQTYTIKGIVSNGDYNVNVKVPTKTGVYGDQLITWKVGSKTGSVRSDFTVLPEVLDWSDTKSRENSILSVAKKPYSDDEAIAGKPLQGNIVLQLKDKYNNDTDFIKNGHSLYIWLEDSLNHKLGNILATEGAVTGCKIKETSSNSKFYEITDINHSQLTFSYEIEPPGGQYTVYVAEGQSKTSNTGAIEALTSKKSADVNMTLTQVDIVDYGGITTKPDADAAIKVSLINPPGKDVYLRLPEGFVTNQKEKVITDAQGKEIRLVPLVAGANDMVIKQVPKDGIKEYKDFRLYLGDQLYQPVKYSGSITVHAALIQAKIKNFLDFRHGTQDRTEVASEVQFEFTDLSKQSTGFYIDFPQKTDSGQNSPLKPVNDGETVTTTGGALYWRVKPQVKVDQSGKTNVNVKVEKNPAATDFALNKNGYDQTMTIGLASTLNGKDFEKAQIKLRYRITDSVVDPLKPETTIVTPVGQKETVIDGVMHYQTTTTLELNSEILNGRNLYVWVEDANGNVMTNNPKDRFNITTSSPELQLNNTFLGSVEGSSSGVNNIYTITNAGETASEELRTKTIPLTLTSAKAGTFIVNIAVGSSAQQVYNNPAGRLTTKKFVFVDKDQIPVVKVENAGTIYGTTDGDAADTVYGQVKVTIKNFKLEDKQQGKLTISLNAESATSSQYRLEVPFNDNHKTSGGFYEVLVDVKTPPPFDGAKLVVPVTSGQFEVGVNASNMAVLSRVEWSGEITFSKRPEVIVALQAGDGWQDGKLEVDNTGKINLTVKPADNLSASVLAGKAVHIWLDHGAVVQGDYLQGQGLQHITEGDNAGKYLLPVVAENGQFTKEFSVQGLPVGKYTLMAQAVYSDTQQPAPNCASAGLAVEVVPKAADIWHLAVAVNGKTLTADNTGLFIASPLPRNEAIAVKATVTKGTTPMAGVKVKINGEASQGATVSAQELTTDANGAVTFTITPKVDTDFDYIYGLTATAEEKEQVSGTVKLPVSSKAEPTPPDTKKEGTLEIIGMTSKVAVGDRASIFLEVYDDDDDLIKITSDSMARDMIDRVYFDDLPGNSDLKERDIDVQRVSDGIEISFRPDYRGNYDLVIVGKNNTKRPDITAVRQGEIVRMELEYAESTLGLGKTSSVPVIRTYDRDDVEAERSLLATSRLEFFATGGAVDHTDKMGRVTVKNADRYVGSTIKAVVTDTREDLVAEYVFDIEERSYGPSDNDHQSGNTQNMQVVLWDNYGAVGAQNRFSFYLVGENGFRAELKSGQMSSSMGASATVSVASKPSGATVSTSIYNNGRTLEGGGDGLLYVSCNKEGTVKLNITIKVYNPDKSTNYYKRYDYYRGTVSLQFKENAPVNWGSASSDSSWGNSGGQSGSVSVAMFIGSTSYTVNMNSRTMEAPPFLSDGRTYLPLRALSDAIGAEIYFDDSTQKITIIYGNERVVLQVGSNVVTTTREGSYRVDGAPVIVDGRTFVPLRVVGEALRMRVTTVTDINNKVVGAVLSK